MCRQTIFYPFLHASKFGRGTALRPIVDSPKHDTRDYTDVPSLEAAAVVNEAEGELTLFAVNRNLDESLNASCYLRGFEEYSVAEHIALASEDLKAVNTIANPNAVVPRVRRDSIRDMGKDGFAVELGKASWNVIRFTKNAR